MKIAIVAEHIEAWRGGTETSIQQFARAAAKAGQDIHVIARAPRTPVDGLQIHPLDPYTAVTQWRTLTFARHAATYTAKRSFDIVHAVTPCMTADIYQPRGGFVVESVERNLALFKSPLARALKRFANNFNKKRQGMIRLEQRLLTRSPAPPYIAAVSNYVAAQAQKHFHLPPDRARVIFNGVEPDHTSPEQRNRNCCEIRTQYHLADDDLVLLFVAHNFKLKGLKPLLHAFKRVADRTPSVRLLIVGHGNPLSYRRIIENLAIADRVSFVGPTAQIRPFLHAADILVHPTYYDPCSRVVLEAIATGLPTVTTRYNGAAEILTDNVTGHIIDEPANIPELADAVCKLADPQHRATLAKNALDLQDRIDIENHTRQMIQLYEHVYQEKKGTPPS